MRTAMKRWMTHEAIMTHEIDTEMYLRDGAPHATVCKVVTKDGRVGIGVYRGFHFDQPMADREARQDAVQHLPSDGLCTTCRINAPNHRAGRDQHLCCECYVRAGHAPADWHSECLRAYAEYHRDTIHPDTADSVAAATIPLQDTNDLQAALGRPAYP